jgi:hypothetical protein
MRRREVDMEIAEYARLLARRSRIIVVAAIAAGVLATLVFVTRPRMYAASSTVVVPSPPTSTSLIASVAQSVSDFQAALSTTVVAERVASSVGITTSAVKSGLEPSRVSDSGLVEVRFEYPDPEIAEDVAFEASRQALILLLDSRLEPFESQLAIVRDQYEAAQAALLEFQEETGYVVPQEVFEQENREMQSLRDAIGAALADGNEELAAQLQERLDEKAERLVSESVEFSTLTSAQRRAEESFTATQIARDAAAASLESVEETENPSAEGAISSTDAVGVGRLQTFLRTVVPAIVIATILAIVLVALLEIVPAGRSSNWARLKSRLPLEDRSRSASTVARLQAMAARRRNQEADREPVAPATEASDPARAVRPSSQISGGSDGTRSRERVKRPRLRVDPAEEALAVQERRAVQEARAAAEAKRRAAAEAEARAAEEAKARAAEEARRRVVEEARRRAAEEAQVRAAEEAKRRAAEEAQARAAEEAKRRGAEEAKAMAAEEEKARAAEEEKARAAEEEKARAAEEEKARVAEEAKAAEDAKAKAAEDAKAKAAEDAKAKAAEDAKRKAAEDAKAKAGTPHEATSKRPSVEPKAPPRAEVDAKDRPPRQSGSAKARRKRARAAQGGASPQSGGSREGDVSPHDAGAGSGEQEQVTEAPRAVSGSDSTSAKAGG